MYDQTLIRGLPVFVYLAMLLLATVRHHARPRKLWLLAGSCSVL